jgi:hypothetical protein
VSFEADIGPDTFTAPFSYTIDHGDGDVVTGSTSDDPMAWNHPYTVTGTHTVQVSVWNCEMSVPVMDSVQVTVMEEEEPEPPTYYIYLPVVIRD